MPDNKFQRIQIFEGLEFLSDKEIENITNIQTLHGQLYSRFYDLLDYIKLQIPADEKGNLPAGMVYFLQKFEEHSDSILNRYDVKSITRATRLIDSLIESSLEGDTKFSREVKKLEPALIMFSTEMSNFRKMVRILSEFGNLSLNQMGLSLELRSRDLLIYFEPKLRKAFNRFDESEQVDFEKLKNDVSILILNSSLPNAYKRFLQKTFNVAMQVRRVSPNKLDRIISDLRKMLARELENFELGFSDEERLEVKIFCRDLRLMKARFKFLLNKEQ